MCKTLMCPLFQGALLQSVDEAVEPGKRAKVLEVKGSGFLGGNKTILILPSGKSQEPQSDYLLLPSITTAIVGTDKLMGVFVHYVLLCFLICCLKKQVSLSLSVWRCGQSFAVQLIWEPLRVTRTNTLRLWGQRPYSGPSPPPAGRGAAACSGPS